MIETSNYIKAHNREKIYRWFLDITKRLTERQMLLILAVVVGVLAGLATYLFKLLLHFIEESLVGWFDKETSHILYLVYPVVGIILATLFVKYIVRDNISEGVTRVLYAMSSRGSRIAGHNCWTSMVGGAVTIGFGGSVGPEAPIVLTGAALGSNVGKLAKLNYKNITLLLCCGAGAAVAAVFKAPITGVVFVLEILMLDITSASIIPLLVSSVTATTIALVLRGFDPIISVTLTAADAFQIKHIPLFITLGVMCGGISYYFTTINAKIGRMMHSIKSQYLRWLVAGLILGGLIFVFPPLYGEGPLYGDNYQVFTSLIGDGAVLNGDEATVFDDSLFYQFRDIDWVILIYVIALTFFKVITMATTNAAGGVGGTFAPSLFVGAFAGAALAVMCHILDVDVSITTFTLVGMAGVMSGVMKAPLTAIFLIAELSNGYGLFIPLMIVSCIAFAVGRWLDPDSIYTKQLRQRGELLTHDKDQSVLVFLKLEELMESDFTEIKEENTLGDIVELISSSRRNIFPVVDDEGHLLGIVQLDDLREDMFKPSKHKNPITNYMIQPPDKILEREMIQEVLPRFEQNHTWMLPVVDKNNCYLGFISKSRILNAYREQLVNITQ